MIDIRHDDGIRLYLDGVLMHQEWMEHSAGTVNIPIVTIPGWHRVTIEYFDLSLGAVLAVAVRDGHRASPVPAAALPCARSGPTGRWLATYFEPVAFDLATLSWADLSTANVISDDCLGNPFAGTLPTTVGSPVVGGPTGYGASYERDINFPGGLTSFNARVQDGMRIVIDDLRVVDDWTANGGVRVFATTLSPGVHRVRVEFRYSVGPPHLELAWTPA